MLAAETSRPNTSVDVTERIERLAAGDPAAKEWLYRRFAPTLNRRIRRRYGTDRHLDAEELLQDLFVWCFQNDGKILTAFVSRNTVEIRTEFRLEGYLWGLVSGIVANRRRTRGRDTNVVALENVQEPSGGDSERSLAERDTLVRLMECMREGAARLFLYFILRFVEGLTPEEVVQVTGWPRSKTYKLKSSLNRAVERCVRLLGL